MSQKENLQNSEKHTWAKYIHNIKIHSYTTKPTQIQNNKRNNTNEQDVNFTFPRGKKFIPTLHLKENIGRYTAQKQKQQEYPMLFLNGTNTYFSKRK